MLALPFITAADLWQAGGLIGATIFLCLGVWTGWNRAKQIGIAKNDASRSELIKLLEASRDEWRDKCESEHQEFRKYQEEARTRINQSSEQILKLTQENTELKMRTDMQPIMSALKEQGAALKEQGVVLERVVKVVEKLEQKMVEHLQFKH